MEFLQAGKSPERINTIGLEKLIGPLKPSSHGLISYGLSLLWKSLLEERLPTATRASTPTRACNKHTLGSITNGMCNNL